MKTFVLSLTGSLLILLSFLAGAYVGQRTVHRFTLVPDTPYALDQITGKICALGTGPSSLPRCDLLARN